MATLLKDRRNRFSGNRFFLVSAFVMAAVVVAGFGTQLAMGRSTFAAQPLVHVHAVLFMGWVSLYVVQNCLIAAGNTQFRKKLGWLGLGWMFAMVLVGIATTIAMVRRGAVPFFFEPAYFLVMNSISILTFAALGITAIVLRRRTEWHRRLHFCAMAFA